MGGRRVPRRRPLRRRHGGGGAAGGGRGDVVVLGVAAQRPRIAVALAAAVRLAFVRFLVAVGQHVTV